MATERQVVGNDASVVVRDLTMADSESSRDFARRKREFLRAWAKQNHNETVEKAKEALRQEFGETVSQSAIAEIMREARLAHRQRVNRAVAAYDGPEEHTVPLGTTSTDVVKRVVEQMKAAGIVSITINQDGTVSVIMT